MTVERAAHYAQCIVEAIATCIGEELDLGNYEYDEYDDILSCVVEFPSGTAFYEIEQTLLAYFTGVIISVGTSRGSHSIKVKGGQALWDRFLANQKERSGISGRFSIYVLIKRAAVIILITFLILALFSFKDALNLQQAWQLDHHLQVTTTPGLSFILQATWLKLTQIPFLW